MCFVLAASVKLDALDRREADQVWGEARVWLISRPFSVRNTMTTPSHHRGCRSSDKDACA